MNELERKIKSGDKEGLKEDFKQLLNLINSTHISQVMKLQNLLFVDQVRSYILEEATKK